MPYAANGLVSREPVSGGIPITDEQYDQAINGMMNGMVVTIRGGFRLVAPSEAPSPEAPEPTFEELRAGKMAEIDAAFGVAANDLTAGYPDAERLTWPIQEREARAWEVDSDAPTPFLDGLAANRGISADQMRRLTLAQVDTFMFASQALVGKRQRLRDEVYAIDAATPNAGALLAAIVW